MKKPLIYELCIDESDVTTSREIALQSNFCYRTMPIWILNSLKTQRAVYRPSI